MRKSELRQLIKEELLNESTDLSLRRDRDFDKMESIFDKLVVAIRKSPDYEKSTNLQSKPLVKH